MNSKVEISVGELRATFLGKRGLGVVGRGVWLGGRGSGLGRRGVGGRGSGVGVKGVTRPGPGNDFMAEPSAGLVKPSTNASCQWDEVVCCSRHGLRWDR